MSPFARTGDLADEVLALATNLRKAGNDVTVVLPFYRCVREDKSVKAKRTKIKFPVTVGPSRLSCEIYEATAAGGVQVLFVARDEFFDRTGLYGVDGRDYQDNSARFVFFTKCVIEIAKRLPAAPDILHVHGWQTALLPVFVREQSVPGVTVLTPHGLEYQGNFWSYDFGLTNLPGEYFSARGVEYYGSMNCLKAGILYSDAVVLPGRRHVAEMQTADHGCGLESILREQSYKLEGIPDGLDEEAWPVLPIEKAGKDKVRNGLFARAGLAPGGRVFLADASATMGADIDILLQALDRLPSDDIRVLFLGPVAESSRKALGVALRRHASIFANIPEVGGAVFQQALAGAEFLLLPGPVEPGGELVMMALRNGVVPVAAQCGGLRQFVQDYDPTNRTGNGFVFYRQTTAALVDAIRRAIKTSPDELASIVATARAADFSWPACARRHEELYSRLLVQAGRAVAA